MSPVSWVGKISKRSGAIPPCQEAGSPVRFRLSQNSHQFWVAELRCADLTAHSLSLLRDSIQGSCWNMNIISIKLFRGCRLFNKDVDIIKINPVSVFSLRVLSNSNFIPFKYIYNNIYNDIYSDIYKGIYYENTFLIEIYIIIINSLLTALTKVVIKIIITSINISYLILFEALSFKINIKEAVNSSYTAFYSVFIWRLFLFLDRF